MRAARYHQYGEPDVIHIEEVSAPQVPAHGIRIKTRAASVNPVDTILRSGRAQELLPLELPAIPGRDAAGIVEEVGVDVTGVKVGDAVFGLGGVSDTTAEYSVLTAWARIPSTWSFEQAAAAGLASNTAVRGLDSLGDLKEKTLLIDGAAGSVGSAAASIAISRGAKVIGTANQRNHAFLKSIGVIATPYGPGLAERVAGLAPQGVDVALDAAGAGSLPELVRITGGPERVTTVADHTAPTIGVRLVNAENESGTLEVAAALGEAGLYLPRIARSFPLDQTIEAHILAQGAGTQGKVVVAISA
ncbi:NADP-dependent oxidoreductase [Nesterenkonia sp. E16_7]|uniref:NADP-dependent oxidoreductase n=1 Tax=unclassified Nesterenkonia TaxID=2629769 RepID=UPI001A9347A8|nr:MULTISPECIES: NADP-dependent oxidoreductase [unclassified Nesterenkonia]MBO0594890.1 NADP-dependent oxidoreductase [Nesterenkonia sp. E16_10]MBO0599826.1 NADP-dependent oxidoreductase [Nesterenkonia sp. E16_7]